MIRVLGENELALDIDDFLKCMYSLDQIVHGKGFFSVFTRYPSVHDLHATPFPQNYGDS